MKCYCGKLVAPGTNQDKLCRKHYIAAKEKVYLDNSNPEDLGILKWARDILPEYLPNKSPKFHNEILFLLFCLYDPFYRNKYERLRNIISFRGSSKSTLINMIFVIYILAHIGMTMKIRNVNQEVIDVVIDEKFFAIGSETGISAEDFVVRIRDEISTNEMFAYFYNTDIKDAQDAQDGQWTRRAFKYNGCFVLGVGVGMQIRGKIKGAYRVTFFLFDDIYSENNTITDQSRSKVRKWFENAAMNSVDDLKGKAAAIGTIVHEDTILVDNERAENWKTVKYYVMPLKKFEDFVSKHLLVDRQKGTCRLPFHEEEDEIIKKTKQREYFTKVQESQDWELAWAERLDLYFLALKYQDVVEKRTTSSLYQEYFHEIVSDELKRIKPEYFRREDFEIIEQDGFQLFKCSIWDDPVAINIEIGVDTATGTTDGDDAVVVVSGILANGYKVVIEVIAGKYPVRDVRRTQTAYNLGQVVKDRDELITIGIVDEAIRKAVEYRAKKIKIGWTGTEKTNVETCRQLAYANGIYGTIVVGRQQDQSEGTKRERILNRLSPFYSQYAVIHNKGLESLEYQLQHLTSCTYDDIADAAEVSFYEMQAPSNVNIQTLNPQQELVRWKKLKRQEPIFDWRVN